MLGLVYDTETTGIPDYKSPSDGEGQPHIVQLVAKVFDLESKEEYGAMNVLVKPDGWEIPQETIDVHGITNEKASDEGIAEEEAVGRFFDMWLAACDTDIAFRIGHNETFDRRIIRIASKRYASLSLSVEPWKELPKNRSYCTCNKSKAICQLPPTGAMKEKTKFKYKNPTLGEAYKFFTGKELEGAHDAEVDVDACATIFWHLQETANALEYNA